MIHSLIFENLGKAYNDILENCFSEEERAHIKKIRLPELEELTKASTITSSSTLVDVNSNVQLWRSNGVTEMIPKDGVAMFEVRPVIEVEY